MVAYHTMADSDQFVDLNESISELSIQGDEELFDSTFELPNFGVSESSNRDSRELDSQSTLSQVSYTDESISSFKKFPELARYFKKRKVNEGKVEITCQACSSKMNTRELKRLTAHASKCQLVTTEDREYLSVMMNGDRTRTIDSPNKTINDLWASVIVENNISLSCVNSATFKAFVSRACPGWRPASRDNLAKTYIASLSHKVTSDFLKSLEDSQDVYLSVEFDHWLDANNKSLLGVIITYGQGSRYVCDLIDVSTEGHSTQVIVDKLVKCLRPVNPSCINAFVSDSASACKAAREQLTKLPQFQHVLQHRCLAHLINRIGNCVAKDEAMSASLDWAARVARVVSSSPAITAKLRMAGKSRVTRYCQVRWYSQVDMVESLLSAKEVIVKEFSNSHLPELRDLVRSEMPWVGLERALGVIAPLARCIAIAERRNGRVGEAFRAILDLGREIFDKDWSDPLYFSAIKAFLTYICPSKLNNSEFGILVAAYSLDPRNKLDYLTEAAEDLALATINDIAADCGFSLGTIDRSISPEFETYVIDERSPRKRCSSLTAEEWWRKKRDCGALKFIAIKLANLRSSSANIERTFSTLRYIQGHNRLRLSLKTFADIARVKISLQQVSELKRDSRGSDVDLSLCPRIDSNDIDDDDISPTENDEHEILDNIPRNHQPNLLPAKLRSNYREFCKYIDYTIVCQPDEPMCSGDDFRIDRKELEAVLKNSQQRRAQRKARESSRK